MAKRGPKSSAEIALTAPGVTVAAMHRPEPPYSLWRDEEQDVWRRIVADLPADWFSGRNLDLLAEYCTAAVSCRRLAQMIHACEHGAGELDVPHWLALMRAHAAQSSRMQALATSMRITQQSTYTPKRGATALRNNPTGPRPWE